MTVISIDDTNDPRLSRYADLRSDPQIPDTDSFIVEGRWCVEQLASSPYETISVVVQQGREQEVAQWFEEAVPIYSLARDRVQALVGYDFHRGILACGRRSDFRSIQELSSELLSEPSGQMSSSMALAILGVSQRDNLGSMIRTATALGVRRIVLGSKTADPLSRRATRVSMGTVFNQALFCMDDPLRQIRELSAHNIRTVVTSLDADAIPIDRLRHDDRPIVLIVGNEAAGVAKEVSQVATDRVTIPMHSGVDSLNVSVAAAIFLYEISRFR